MCGLDTKTLELIESCFKKYPEIVWVKIYGSRAKGNYRHGSDIDLAFSSSVNYSAKLLGALENLPLPYLFDVTHYESLKNQALKEHIDRVGVLIFESANLLSEKKKMNKLFEPLQLGAITLPNRILMAPLTRCRTGENHVPSDLMATHYAQRASAGLIIAEATMAIEGNSAFWKEPAIYSPEQIAGWKKVTDAVHEKGGLIFLQIWHGGRACYPLFNNGAQPVAPSAIAINGEVFTSEGMKPYVEPRELRLDELPEIINGFKKAAENAKEAGFDGVEIHGANGYLLDEFLRDGSNTRTDEYGGSIENRARLMLEVLQAVCDVWGSQRVGLRLSPLNSYNSMIDSDPVALSTWMAKRLNDFDLAYLHVMRSDFLQQQSGDVLTPIRENYKGVLIGNMGYDAKEAEEAIATGKLDAVSFGVSFIANPDLPARIKTGAELNVPNPETFYLGGEVGYTDYPALDI